MAAAVDECAARARRVTEVEAGLSIVTEGFKTWIVTMIWMARKLIER
jgi:hypothetical protein